MTQSTPTHTFTIDIKCDTGALNQLESQLKNIAEQMDRITGRRYDAGMKLSADVSVKTGITADSFKVFDSEGRLRVAVAPLSEAVTDLTPLAGKVFVKEASISQAVIKEAVIKGNDNHIRQIVREEIRQFVTRESGRGGLFSKW
ncbi:hypothetical protein [Xenorhabdus bovienii]|uniref:Uncharacterized protein n=1 Tax=Xenorhabdus bovienii TaxID=40576 RepID=A0A0B6X917_XENBV|nr:hypothetical protein [Xenorhabdus bovienii]CDM89676.1 conserved protein of unknown function [Xenorhabdus bovienii]